MSRKKVLFVCVANTCRSAMAEYILKDLAGDRFDASSAGLNAYPGVTMEPYAIRILDSRLAGNLHRLHRSRRLTRPLMEEADIVIAMREDYARAIREEYPEFACKVTSLGEINMPLFMSEETMEQCYDAIKAGITELLLSEKN